MSEERYSILHIGGDLTSARLIREALTESRSAWYEVEWVGTLSDGLEQLTRNRMSLVLLDQLPDSTGIEGLEKLRLAAPAVPIIVVGANRDDEIERQTMQAGAHDYLVTKQLDGYWLPRVLGHAIEEKRAEEAFLAERERAEVSLASNGYAVLKTDMAGRITELNVIAEQLTGWPNAQAAGRSFESVMHLVDAGTRDPTAAPPARAFQGHETSHQVSTCILIRRDGSESTIEYSAAPTYDRLGLVIGVATVCRDVTASSALSLQVSHLASHDALTDLPNRLLLRDRLARALALAHRHQRRLAVLFLDIDHFKYINDSLGHMLGDQLLRAVAREVTMCVRSSDTVSRHGGDEFVIVLSELEHTEDAARGAQKIIAALARPYHLLGHDVHITVSIGISVYPGDGEEAETLLRNADLALYHAKGEGRDCYQFFTPALKTRAVERQSIEEGLRTALDKRELELFYQPKINLKTGAVVGSEALIRWRHPNRGLIEPAEFVPIAEDCGLIRPIGRWVVHEACRQAQAWQTAGLPAMPVSVNISAVEFRGQGFLKTIVDTLTETCLDPRYLEIELTESVLMAHVESANTTLRALKTLGVQLAIDDFGTGCSSLSYLRHFPIDALKVDRSFVQEITSRPDAASIVRAVISMGNSLKHRVIAEGVETSEQLVFLQAENCEEGQGHYFSRPLAAQQFARVLETVQPGS